MVASAGTSTTVHAKEFHFPVTVEWLGERRVAARVEGKPAVEIAPPPVFRAPIRPHGVPRTSSSLPRPPVSPSPSPGLPPAPASPTQQLKVDGDGIAGKRSDGRFGFTRLLLRVQLETDAADEAQVRELAEQAEQTCLVSASLDLPIETMIEVKTALTPREHNR